MIRLVWTLLAALTVSFALTGCRAEVEVDDPDNLDAPGEPDTAPDTTPDGTVGD